MLRYWYRRYLGWLPVQFCVVCGKPYWGGWPRFTLTQAGVFSVKLGVYGKTHQAWTLTNTWQAYWQDYCSKKCNDADWE